MAIVSADFGGRRARRRILHWSLLVAALLAILWLLPRLLHLYTEWLWFNFDVRYPGIFWTLLKTKIGLGLCFGAAFLLLLLGNVSLARRFAKRTVWYEEEQALRQRVAEVMEYFASRYLYLGLVVFALVIAYGVAVAAAGHWNQYLLFRHGGSFGITDPIDAFGFQRDIGFYVFRLPFWQYLWQWSYVVLIAVFVIVAATHYFDKAIRVLRGIPAFAPHVKSHLSVLLGLLLVVKALGYRIEAYHLLYSPRGVTFGASYTDIHAQLLAYNILFVIALACAVLVFINMYFRGLWLPLAGIGFLALSSLLLNVIYPAVVERIQVKPNQLQRETPYIAHTIEFTRRGFALDRIDEEPLSVLQPLDMADIQRNVQTVANARLWDYRPLLDTYQNQQRLWDYYRFHSVDVDRYVIDGRYRQVMLAGRELDLPSLVKLLPERTWQNEHVFYTHGCGLVMSPVSDILPPGQPNYVMKNIPPESSFEMDVSQHGIYYGELTEHYVIVGTSEEENDYTLPKTNEIAKTRYSGKGGVPIGSALPRMAVAARFQDINLLISTIIGKDSRILWGRRVSSRARDIAPFLAFDRDPYMVVGTDGSLYWIQDAYTTSAMYPYSEPIRNEAGGFNYVRNSVKIVTDAYHGSVTFYVADAEDPIIQAYQRIFPGVFHPMKEMPAGLLAHIRYPEALFNAQSARLTVYHMTDPRVFYNRIEKWAIARERPKSVGPGGSPLLSRDTDSQGEAMQAYYAILKLPDEEEPEYVLMLPFTPEGRPNMVAWLAARCDGEHYGKLLLYNFAKTEQVWGPLQIEASIDQDTEISQLLTLWNQQGSSVIRGNLLVIPLDSSLLYVEPIYLRAAQSPFPELKRVIVASGDGAVVMERTLSRALSALLQAPAPDLAVLEPSVREGEASVFAEGEEAAPPSPGEEATPPAAAPDVRALALQADRYFNEALDRQRQGDWAGYGESLAKLRQTIQQLTEKTKQ
jgi:uncharacterized membrane protein (UPF0182 family)